MFRKKFYGTWVERQAYVAMLMNSLFLVVLGAWILNPFSDAFGGYPTFHAMQRVMPELSWGVCFLVAGLLKLVSSVTAMYRLARASAFLVFSLWFISAWSMVTDGVFSPTVVMVSYLAAQAAHHYIMINHKQNLPLESN